MDLVCEARLLWCMGTAFFALQINSNLFLSERRPSRERQADQRHDCRKGLSHGGFWWISQAFRAQARFIIWAKSRGSRLEFSELFFVDLLQVSSWLMETLKRSPMPVSFWGQQREKDVPRKHVRELRISTSFVRPRQTFSERLRCNSRQNNSSASLFQRFSHAMPRSYLTIAPGMHHANSSIVGLTPIRRSFIYDRTQQVTLYDKFKSL